MNPESAVPVAEAARDFLRLLDWVESRGESATLVRDGRVVAMLSPVPAPASTAAELADRCHDWTRLPPEEANAFAHDVESARRTLPALRSAWD